jgi:hypothetical protein
VESDLLGLHFTIFDINLVTDEGYWDVLTDSHQILVPLWHVLVGDSRADIEHDDTTVATNVVSISESSELLLTGCVPNIEEDLALGCEERHWMHLDTESSDVLLFEFSCQMSLDKSSLADTTISDENELEFRNWTLRFHSTNWLVKLG